MYLSIIIPAFNEEKRIAKTLLEIDRYLKKQSYDYEIIVVNDGSKDETVKVIRELKIANLKIIDNKENRGKGYAVRQGLSEAKGAYRLFTDADNSTSIKEIEKFFPYSNEYDIMIGSRSLKGSIISASQPFYRAIGGKWYGLLAHAIVGLWGIKDTQCGFKFFSAKAIDTILPKCIINGWSFDSEILVIAKSSGYTIKEIPIIWSNQIQTKVTSTGIAKAILDLLRIRWNLIIGRYQKT